MFVSVLLFAGLREAAGTGRVEVALPESARVEDALDCLEQRALLEPRRRGSFAVAVNRSIVGPDAALAPGDELALLPPVGGG